MKTKYKYIHFEQWPIKNNIKIKGQTHLWHCISDDNKKELGYFIYNFKFQLWEFCPNYGLGFIISRLADIIDFMKQLEKPK